MARVHGKKVAPRLVLDPPGWRPRPGDLVVVFVDGRHQVARLGGALPADPFVEPRWYVFCPGDRVAYVTSLCQPTEAELAAHQLAGDAL